MSEFVRIGSKADLPGPGDIAEFRVNGRSICVANLDGKYAAIDNACAHMGAPLSSGTLSEGKIVCPWHGWEYDPATGKSDVNPEVGVRVYELRFEGDDVLVRI